jgi:hypothetical protein
MLDKALRPELYAWEELADEAAKQKHAAACDRARERGVRPLKKRTARRRQ